MVGSVERAWASLIRLSEPVVLFDQPAVKSLLEQLPQGPADATCLGVQPLQGQKPALFATRYST
jgi:hypothetical protein